MLTELGSRRVKQTSKQTLHCSVLMECNHTIQETIILLLIVSGTTDASQFETQQVGVEYLYAMRFKTMCR